MTSITLARPKRFVVSSVSSDAHMWNLVFLQLLLEEQGGDVINLGACVPDELIIDECRRIRPDVLVISTVNGHGHLDGLRLIRKIREDPDLVGLRVVIGGKLGVKGAGNAKYVDELVTSGFDAAFESDAGLGRFEEFLASLEPAKQPALTNRQPEPTNRQPALTNRQPEPTNGQPALTGRQPEPTNRQPELVGARNGARK
ncbi:cobalamin-dependent protein [Kitasatospora sp. NBC_00374]|uniref:cobalamin B12-binding domain-containing protein n=1 Tax=Kitasatospora sp. NBC_00374 TaxID=2975964 RepID=UPI003253BBF6